MNRWGPRYPKSLLHEFYVHGGTPAFEVEDCLGCLNPPKFTCRLTIPAVNTPYGGFDEHIFNANSRSKKAAEHAAAEKALAFIADRGLLQPPMQGTLLTASSGSAPPGSYPVMEEVRQLKQHIQDLSSQLAASQEAVSVLPPHEASLDSELDREEISDQPEAPNSNLTEDELRIALKKAYDVNARLRQDLKLEQERRQAAVKTLLGPRD